MSVGLTGKRIVNTRAEHQAKALDDLLLEHGAVPVAYPCISIAPPDDPALLDDAIKHLIAGRYDWLVLTSANTVTAIAERAASLNLTLPPNDFRTAAIGPATAAAACEHLGIPVDEIPESFVSDVLATSLHIKPGHRLLLPVSALAEQTLAEGLRARGGIVDVIMAYRTVCHHEGARIAPLLAERQVDAFVFTSASTVRCCAERVSAEGIPLRDVSGIPAACIGSKTEKAALDVGFHQVITPDTSVLSALVDALDMFFARQPLPENRHDSC